MQVTRRLHDGEEITYEQASNSDVNLMQQLGYYDRRLAFCDMVRRRKLDVEAAVASHLGVQPHLCLMSEEEQWMYGSFNLCVPVSVPSPKLDCNHRVIMRFPFNYRIGEDFRPGNADEKIRCEAATYAWLEQNCPKVPIPKLYGFALSTGRSFTATREVSFLRRGISLYCNWQMHPYVPNARTDPCSVALGVGYILIDFIEESQGVQLSSVLVDGYNNFPLRERLLRNLAHIHLEIARIPLPSIGSFTVDDFGRVELENRPLLREIVELEAESIPIDIPRDRTYSTSASFVNDILHNHDLRFRHAPNGARDGFDAVRQMFLFSVMRLASHHLSPREHERGPFALTLTDCNVGNIMVDEKWNVTSLLDLEWACSLPLHMQRPPMWLALQGLKEIDVGRYDGPRRLYMSRLRKQEEKSGQMKWPRLSTIMENSWKDGTFWWSAALESLQRMSDICEKHILSRYGSISSSDELWIVGAVLWSPDAYNLSRQKETDKERYDEDLKKLFGVEDPENEGSSCGQASAT